MSVPDALQLRRSRIQLLLIFALFLLPPVSAWVAWQYLGEAGVETTTNAGTLITPARPLRPPDAPPGETPAWAGVPGRWTFVLFAPVGCDESCERQLYLTRQIRIAMNKDISRVQRVLVLGEMPTATQLEALDREHVDLEYTRVDPSTAEMRRAFSGPGFAPDGEQYFLVDPLGNLMMRYGPDVPAKGLMKDLRKLLKVSQVG